MTNLSLEVGPIQDVGVRIIVFEIPFDERVAYPVMTVNDEST